MTKNDNSRKYINTMESLYVVNVKNTCQYESIALLKNINIKYNNNKINGDKNKN